MIRLTKHIAVTFAVCLGLALAFALTASGDAQAQSSVLYVNRNAAGPAHNGLSWTTAFTEVQSALVVAAAGDEIWVAQGVYYPNFYPASQTYTTTRGAWFSLPSNVGLYGGFAGTETARDQRNWATNVTVLSGDIDRNDRTDANGVITTTANISGANAYTVISVGYVSMASVLDGFTITGGQANGSGGQWLAPHRSGGGLYCNGGSVTLRNLTVIGNYAEYGGGMAIFNNTPMLANIAFLNNSAYAGGGMVNYNNSGTTLVGLTFNGNSATYGGGIYNHSDGNPALVNSILWGNTAPTATQVYNTGGSVPSITYSDVQGGYAGTGNIDADPLFVAAASGNLRLRYGSPAIDVGSNAALPAGLTTDLGGLPRIINGVVDMGAYEYSVPRYVATTGTDVGDCADPAHPCRTVQYAVNMATVGDDVRVAMGIYTSTASQVALITKTLVLQGGYTTSNWNTPDPAANPTTLDGQNARRGLYISGAITPTVSGLRITHGTANGLAGGGGLRDSGGGIYIIQAAATISNCMIYSNTARLAPHATGYGYGGGIYAIGSRAQIINSVVQENVGSAGGTGHGGGVYLVKGQAMLMGSQVMSNTASTAADGLCGGVCLMGDNLTVRDNVIQGNIASRTANGAGGGLYLDHSAARLDNNLILNNTATLSATASGLGGGVYMQSANAPAWINNLVANNHANTQGSGLYWSAGSGSLLHTTIANNTGSGQGVSIGNSAMLVFSNTIIAGHASAGITATTGSTVTLQATLWNGNGQDVVGAGNIVSSTNVVGAPAFRNPAAGDYHLTAASAAIDAGVNAGVATDLDGNSRPWGNGYDLGCYESHLFKIYLPLVVR